MKLSFTALLAAATAAVATASDMPNFSAVYSMTNAETNEVIVWSRDVETGELDYEGSVSTGGSGGSIVINLADFNSPTFPNPPDPFTAQDPMVVSGRCLLAVNAGSDTVSSFRLLGSRNIKLAGVYPTNGVFPVSVAALDDLVYVLNAGLSGSFQGYRLDGDSCQMTTIGESVGLDQTVDSTFFPEFGPEIPFGTASPAQIGFTPKGDILVTIKINDGFSEGFTDEPQFGSLNHYKIGPDGTTSADALTVTKPPRPLTGPFGFDFDNQGILLLSEVFIQGGLGAVPPRGGVSFWEETDGAYTEVSDYVVTGAFTCWNRYNPANQCLYVTNSPPTGSISSVSTAGGNYELVEAVAGGLNGPLDLIFSADYRYLYVYSSGFFPSPFGNGQPQVVVYEVADDCGLTEVEGEGEGFDPVDFTNVVTNGPTGVAIFPDPNSRSSPGPAPAAPAAVSCTQDSYALCAYAKCAVNPDMTTASCPCFELSGPSLARVDVIPDEGVRAATMEQCTDAAACADGNAPICDAIADGSLWPGADAVSTFSRALEVENGVVLDAEGARGAPTWTCDAPEGGRLVPNCMLAPCRFLSEPVTGSYYSGEATMECTCPLIRAEADYAIFGGLEDPCDGDSFVNVGGPVLVAHAMDSAAVASAWEAVGEAFDGVAKVQ